MEPISITYKGKVTNSDEARSFWRMHNIRQKKIEKHFASKISGALKEQINDFKYALNNYGYAYAKSKIDVIVDGEKIAKVIKKLYQKAAYIESNYVLNYLRHGKKDETIPLEQKRVGNTGGPLGLSFESLASVVDQYFDLHLLNNSAIPITDYTKKIITRHLIDRIDNGEPLQDAITNFNEVAVTWTGRGGKADRRARMIAVTESTRSMSFGGLIGAYMSGIDLDKVWVTSHDERVRGALLYPNAIYKHTALDLNVAHLRGEFYNGENIKFPGDPDASVENIANCRCAMYFREKARPKPRRIRSLANFIIDIIQGFIIGDLLGELINE